MIATVGECRSSRTRGRAVRKRRPVPPKRGRDDRREVRFYLAERDGWQCFYCRAPFSRLAGMTMSHYVPRSLWACNLPANLVLACEPCNQAKADGLTWSMAAVLLAYRGPMAAGVDSAAA
jgi:5-methylcytosine-specific restriction endonuclease McrA